MTITEAELAEALRRRSYLPDPDVYAREVFADIAGRREPEYEPYEIYEAGDGRKWEFYADEDGQRGWLLPGQAAKYAFGFPARPLRRLVPEGTKTDHGQILDELTQWTNLPRTEAIDLAWRICKLIGGECNA